MANSYFRFRQFTIHQEHAAFRITTDSVLLGAWSDLYGVSRVLDVGTGTGILALMAAQRCGASIVALEPDRNSFMQAGLNITASPWPGRITILNRTLQEYLSDTSLLFDTIITNPPFFNASLPNPDLRKAATRHSLTLTHMGLIEASLRLLAPDGTLQLVLPVSEALKFTAMAGEYSMYCWRRLSVRPTPDLPPARMLMTFGRKKHDCEETVMVIEKEGRHVYSDEYVSLTKDFYLKF